MAGQKISQLPEITVPHFDDVLPIVDSGVTSKITVQNLIKDFLSAGPYTYLPAISSVGEE